MNHLSAGGGLERRIVFADDSSQCEQAKKTVVLRRIVPSFKITTIDYQLGSMHSQLIQVQQTTLQRQSTADNQHYLSKV